MALMGKIRRLYFRDRLSSNEIARRTSLSRNTIKKWLKAPGAAVPKYRRREVLSKLTPFAAALTQALETDAHRARHERRTARALHAELKIEGYTGGYTRLTDFIREWRQREGKTASTHAFVPLQFELGDCLSVRLERGRVGRGRDLPPATGGSLEAVRQPRFLAGGLPQPRP